MNDLKVVAGDEGFQKADKGRKADEQRERLWNPTEQVTQIQPKVKRVPQI